MNSIKHSNAEFSPCRTYRYTLWRSWNRLIASGDSFVNFICLNPSTADETKNDRTISKCIKFAKAWGFDGLCVTNLFGYRSTDRKVLKKIPDPIGPENDHYLVETANQAKVVVAAWSQDGSLFGRSAYVRSMINKPLYALRVSKEPWHPLYLPDTTQPVWWKYSDLKPSETA